MRILYLSNRQISDENSCLVAVKRTNKLNKITYSALVGGYVFLLLSSAFYTKNITLFLSSCSAL